MAMYLSVHFIFPVLLALFSYQEKNRRKKREGKREKKERVSRIDEKIYHILNTV